MLAQLQERLEHLGRRASGSFVCLSRALSRTLLSLQAVGGQALPQLMRDNVEEDLLVATLSAISLVAGWDACASLRAWPCAPHPASSSDPSCALQLLAGTARISRFNILVRFLVREPFRKKSPLDTLLHVVSRLIAFFLG